MDFKLRINSLLEMDEFAHKISFYISKGFIIGLKGDLGSGKTTFTKYLAFYLGVHETVNSPTFTILKIYQGKLPVYHIDAYRLENSSYDYELDEFIYDDGVAIIEWYPYIEQMLPKDFLAINIEFVDEFIRDITVKGSGKYAKIVQEISY
ncbi:MAG: tRNA (adenosine(37)-N6)-threonylcarbamoyltransferase complex ATPase subunit type 1 TsaE [Firmicutes bacterium]|nr:tRNA (adenosine(37)-N6)-threonylcarbamoyltransferase complex ATPase subunit type 1 TsaE [Bacillota bacterium]